MHLLYHQHHPFLSCCTKSIEYFPWLGSCLGHYCTRYGLAAWKLASRAGCYIALHQQTKNGEMECGGLTICVAFSDPRRWPYAQPAAAQPASKISTAAAVRDCCPASAAAAKILTILLLLFPFMSELPIWTKLDSILFSLEVC
jgi:hypothetical protein